MHPGAIWELEHGELSCTRGTLLVFGDFTLDGEIGAGRGEAWFVERQNSTYQKEFEIMTQLEDTGNER